MSKLLLQAALYYILIGISYSFFCPPWKTYGKPPPSTCIKPTDPLGKQKSPIEDWLTKEVFEDLFPKANLGWGPNSCSPYSYESFVIAARYFPKFGGEYVTKDPEGKLLNTNYTANETYKRDVSAFFAHSIQETGENNAHIYDLIENKTAAGDCYYRGGLYNWFEGGPQSSLVKDGGVLPNEGVLCTASGRYCLPDTNNKWFYPCNEKTEGQYYKGCYFGRGAIQISYNCNYGLFNRYLQQLGIRHNGKPIDILENPNLVMTKTDPPLSFLASLWFYMTPQSPKPAMHDIVIGNWVSPDPDYAGGVFGPTSLVINKECSGEDPADPGRSGESRRIKAFRWFTNYFNVPFCNGDQKTVSCNEFNRGSKSFKFFDGRIVYNSWDANWNTIGDPTKPCACDMKTYQGYIVAFDPQIMPQFSEENQDNKMWCERLYQSGWKNESCSRYQPQIFRDKYELNHFKNLKSIP